MNATEAVGQPTGRLWVNVTLPVFNEVEQLAGSLARVRAFLAEQTVWRWEVVIADNGSTDGTSELARRLATQTPADPVPIRVVHLPVPGRGRALQTAWLASEAEVLSYMDIDLSTDLAHLPALIGMVAEGRADVAVGSRRAPGALVTRGWKRELLSRGYNLLVRALLGLQVRDAQCGFKALSRRAAQALLPTVQDAGFFFDTELLVRAQWGGWRVVELPVRWVDDPDTRVRLGATIVADLRGLARLWREGRRERRRRR